MRRISASTLLATAIFFSVLSCSKDKGSNTPVDCSGAAKSFATDVNPVIQASCNLVGCHASGSGNGPGALTNYTQVFNARSNIRSAVASGRMPQGSSLSAAQKNAILCWIDSGAPNN